MTSFSVAMPPVAVLCLVVVPLVYLVWRISDELRHDAETRQQPLLMALLVASLLLGAFGYRSANLLEQMERAGLVSSLTSSGQREVLVPARDD